MTSATPRRAAVVGKPVDHSLSPVLHNAAFRALGLDWSYQRIECDAAGLPGLVAGLGPEWVGLSVTMPGKFAALELATERTDRAVRVGSANTLVRIADGWLADCTDVDGAAGLLDECGAAGSSAVVVGAGGTARPVFAALAARGFTDVCVLARSQDRAAGALACADSFGLAARWAPLRADAVPAADVVVSTLPGSAQPEDFPLVDALTSAAPAVADVAYDPWPTLLVAAADSKGARTAGGLTMLLHQAFRQTELFTGATAPRAAMAAALEEHREPQ
ncbi:shikimate dehydrogenase [Tsukamurella paurometabola]|uniref:Shikimate-5-dehydrogenase n=1 Tax=Tsukamurella paurometabola (strain ATCC 8368 / DSM 20162 / CCUG 35730 / CIP 100753 / JCM 10117 / KCTC 9821 / NBRC 16120 / NCIMB 702349 / NCTC 13040) TaxID=521096 RepID=D5UNM2_TSUPD|nr:shikimate dehydrogenase [Tsukamurella paurometabola]ADG78590.1 shikimate-5-dehydrogenase [Tsukamurella paurometabola DSM 20162]